MPKIGGYVCEECGAKSNSPERLKRHKRAFCRGGRNTTGGVDDGTHDTIGTHEEGHTVCPEPTLDDTTEKTGTHGVGTHGTHLSSPDSVLGKGGTHGTHGVSQTPGPGALIDNPRAREEEAVTFLSQHKGYLKPDFELSFYLSMKYKVLGNGEAPRPLTDKERDILFELEYVVRGLVAEDDAQNERDRRSRHDPKDGRSHEGCRYCAEKVEDDRRAQEAMREDFDLMRVRYNKINNASLTYDEWMAFLDAGGAPQASRSDEPVNKGRQWAPIPKAVLRPKAARTEDKNA